LESLQEINQIEEIKSKAETEKVKSPFPIYNSTSKVKPKEQLIAPPTLDE